MTSFGGWGVPGMGALAETTEYEIIWGSERGQGQVLEQNGNYSGTMRDAGNTPTTVIRAGLIMAKLTSTARLEEWVSTASDGTQDIFGVTPYELRAQDFDATDQDKVAGVIVRAPLKAAQLLIQGAAFIGHADEFLARHTLHGGGSILDDDPQGHLAGASWRQKIQLGVATITLTTADNYTSFRVHSVDTNFVLPAVQAGLKFRFLMGEDFELSISSAITTNFLHGGDVTQSGVTFTQAGEQIGAHVEVECMNIDVAGTNTLTWVPTLLTVPFSTDNYLATTLDTA